MRNDTDKVMQPSQDETGRVVMAAKVREETAERLRPILRGKNFKNFNDFIQVVVECVLRYCSDEHNLTPEIEQAMAVFEHLNGWERATLLCKPGQTLDVENAVYFLVAPDCKRTAAVMVTRPFFGDWQQTENTSTIFETVMAQMMPERYRRLCAAAQQLEVSGPLQALDVMLDRQAEEQELADLRSEFEDNDRSEYGRKPVASPYKRKQRRTVDSMTINFEPDDQPEDNSDY